MSDDLTPTIPSKGLSMIHRKYFNGIYGDNLPDGEYVTGIFEDPSDNNTVTHLETHAGNIRLPEGERNHGPRLMFNRLNMLNGLQILAKSHTHDFTYRWRNNAWEVVMTSTGVPAISHGTQGHIWDLNGEPLVFLPCTNCESQGFRYIDPVLGPVMGSPTYNPFSDFARSLGVQLLYGWTHIDGIVVGQTADNKVAIQYAGRVKVLDDAYGEFVQFKKKGDRLAVSWSVLAARQVGMAWLDVADIASLPDYVPPPPEAPKPPTPKPEAPKPPTPTPTPTPTEPRPMPRPDVTALNTFLHDDWKDKKISERTNDIVERSQSNEQMHIELQALHAGWFQDAISEYHHNRGGRNVFLVPKPHGTNYRGRAEDTYVVGEPGKELWYDDAIVNCGGPNAFVSTGNGDLTLSEEPNRYEVPPAPAARPETPKDPKPTDPKPTDPKPTDPKPTDPKPPTDDDEAAFFDLMIEEQIKTNANIEAVLAEQRTTNATLDAIRKDISSFTKELKAQLPAILAGGGGGLLGSILNKKK